MESIIVFFSNDPVFDLDFDYKDHITKEKLIEYYSSLSLETNTKVLFKDAGLFYCYTNVIKLFKSLAVAARYFMIYFL